MDSIFTWKQIDTVSCEKNPSRLKHATKIYHILIVALTCFMTGYRLYGGKHVSFICLSGVKRPIKLVSITAISQF